jgi:tape measure domain-containing protein
MPTLAQANVEITARTGKYKASIADVKRQIVGFGKSATKSLRNVTLGLTAMGVAATAAAVAVGVKLTRALVRAGRETIKTAVKYDKLERGLTAVAGSSTEARNQLTRLQEVAKLPGLSFAEAIQGSTALQAAGLSAELAERSLKAFGNALVTVGKGAEDLKGVNLALTQIVTKQTGFGQELRQLSERLPQVRKAMKDAFGISSVEDFQKLGLAAEDFIEGVVAEFEKLPTVTGTVANDLENLGIAFDRLKNEIGKTMLDITSDVSKSMTKIIDNIRDIIPVAGVMRKQLIVEFGFMAKAGVKLTGEMLKLMAELIKSVGKVIWEPLKTGFILAILEGAEFMLKGGVFRKLFSEATRTLLPFERVTGTLDKMGEAFDKAVQPITAFINKQQASVFESGMTAAANKIDSEMGNLTTTIDAMVNLLLRGLADAEAQTEFLAEQARLSTKFWAALEKSVRGTLAAFGLIEGELSKADKALAKLRAGRGEGLEDLFGLKQEDPAEMDKRLRSARKRLNAERAAIDSDLGKRQRDNLKNFQVVTARQREAVERMRDAFENATSGMRNAFSDFIVDSISDIDNISDAWQSFARNMKNAFIRAAADMIANKAVQSLFAAFKNVQAQTGGGGGPNVGRVLQQGFGTAIGAFLGNLVAPGVGAVIGGGIGGTIAGSIGNEQTQRAPSMVNNFFETDFANMDRNRIQKTVSQTIAPALAEDARDGR